MFLRRRRVSDRRCPIPTPFPGDRIPGFGTRDFGAGSEAPDFLRFGERDSRKSTELVGGNFVGVDQVDKNLQTLAILFFGHKDELVHFES